MAEQKLNDKQMVFVNEYLIDHNATQAAIRAGYSAATAKQQGSRLLSYADVREALRARKAELDAEYENRIMGRYEVLARLTDIAKGDMGDLLGVDANGKVIDDIENLSIKRAKELGKSHLVKKAKVTQTITTQGEAEIQSTTVELEMYSAHEALRDLGKHYVLFTDKVEASGTNGGPIVIKLVEEDKKRA